MGEPSKISEMLQSRERWGRNLVTLLLVGALGAVGLYYWGLIVPWLIEVASDTIKLAGLLAGLGAMLWVIFDPRMRTLLLYGYNSMTKWLTSQFIDIDPIGILQTFVTRLKEKLKEMEEAIGSLQGQRDQLAAFIAKNEQERLKELGRAKTAKKLVEQGGDNAAEMRGQLALSGRQAGRLETSNKTLSQLLGRMDKLLVGLKKMRDTSSVLCQDIEAEVKVKSEEYKMITKGFGAFKHAQHLMASGGAERELYDETLNRLADNYNEKMGQIEYFMEVSKSVINGADLDNMAYEDSALAQLEKWEKESAGLSVPPLANGNGSTGVRVQAPTNVRIEQAEEPAPDSFSSLFNDNDEGSKKVSRKG
jgi:hypothetical protein